MQNDGDIVKKIKLEDYDIIALYGGIMKDKLSSVIFYATLVIASIIPLHAEASRSDLRSYQFTSDFIDCVTRFEDDESEHSRPGKTVSSLMNGSSVLSGPLGSGYWNYMNCLQPTGTSNLNVDAARMCPGLSLPIDGRTMYVPPGKDGKIIGLGGRYWECRGSDWVRISSLPDGGAVSDPSKKECPSTTLVEGQCQFNLDPTPHGRVVEKEFGRYFGHDSNYNGSIMASCKNGSFEVVKSNCEPQRCQEGEIVRWGGFGANSADSNSSRCEGEVYNGIAEQSPPSTRYYPNLEMARDRTVILSGYSEFACRGDRWVPMPGSVCEQKRSEDLSCQGVRSDNGSTKYFCK